MNYWNFQTSNEVGINGYHIFSTNIQVFAQRSRFLFYIVFTWVPQRLNYCQIRTLEGRAQLCLTHLMTHSNQPKVVPACCLSPGNHVFWCLQQAVTPKTKTQTSDSSETALVPTSSTHQTSNMLNSAFLIFFKTHHLVTKGTHLGVSKLKPHHTQSRQDEIIHSFPFFFKWDWQMGNDTDHMIREKNGFKSSSWNYVQAHTVFPVALQSHYCRERPKQRITRAQEFQTSLGNILRPIRFKILFRSISNQKEVIKNYSIITYESRMEEALKRSGAEQGETGPKNKNLAQFSIA